MKLTFPLITFVLILGIIATAKTSLFLDLDFGWHMRTGQYILEHGIPAQDPFSYTMPSFSFIAHSWLSDVGFYALFQRVGYIGLSILVAILTLTSLLINQAPFYSSSLFKKLWLFIPLSLGFSALLPYLSVRPQVFSWLFFALYTLILFNKTYWKKYRIAVPIIMLLWVNMHGAFAIGLVLLLYTIFHRLYVKEGIDRLDIYIILATILVTCINPYGLAIWKEVFSTFASNKLRTQVSEWNPLILRLTFFHIPILALSLVFTIRYYKQLPRTLTNIFVLLLFFGLTSSKLFPFWIIVAVYLISTSLLHLEKSFKSDPLTLDRFNRFLIFLGFLSVSTLLIHLPYSWQIYSRFKEKTFYPQKAISFIEDKNLENNIFTPFNWGGYVLWKMPNRKVFVDGRMVYWKNPRAPKSESSDAFIEHNGLINGKVPPEKIFKKYNIRTVLLPKNDPYPPVQKFRTHIAQKKWRTLYEDEIAIMYSVPRPTSVKNEP